MKSIDQFWNLSKEQIAELTGSGDKGLSGAEAAQRLNAQRVHQHDRPDWVNDLLLFLSQFKNPLVFLLVFAVGISAFLGEYSNSAIIFSVLLLTGMLGYLQERKAGRAVRALKALVQSRTSVMRDGVEVEVPVDSVVRGDLICLNAGDIIPADSYILSSNDLHVNESVLTGESFPVEKFSVGKQVFLLNEVKNAVFKGTSVVNGTAMVLAVNTAASSEIGKIAGSLHEVSGQTAFEQGVKRFGYLLMRITLVFTFVILIVNVLLHRPFIDSLLFSLALTVGLTPELLPAIMTITLSAGARKLAARKVIVKKLDAIENLGSMNLLCTDKTGTLTEGVVELQPVMDIEGRPFEKLKRYAYLNAYYETGFSNPIDQALRNLNLNVETVCRKYDEVPYDFIRKRLSIVIGEQEKHIIITKGSFQNMLDVCTSVETASGEKFSLAARKRELEEQFLDFSRQGFRTLALGYKDVTGDPVINREDECQMIFLGFLAFADPLKEGIGDSIRALESKGIALKLITGDNPAVAAYIAAQIGLRADRVITGMELVESGSESLSRKVMETDVFAEILPTQKEFIVKAFRKAGFTVGFLGDGINDANALKAADVGISIQHAADVAREAADLVLTDKSIDVLTDGVEEGRRTYSNTLKYIHVSTSANFGNMFSMAIASLWLSFLPLLPVQILLNNFLSDLPALAIASDRVDSELIVEPRKWDTRRIWRFMLVFGLQSSIFDFATFWVLIYQYRVNEDLFQTAWFMESLLTEILILLVIRTRRPFFKSRPSRYLAAASLFTFLASLSIPYLPIADFFSFQPLPFPVFGSILLIVLIYVVAAEGSKRIIGK